MKGVGRGGEEEEGETVGAEKRCGRYDEPSQVQELIIRTDEVSLVLV